MIVKHFSLYGRRYYLKLEFAQSLIFAAIFFLCGLLSVWQWQRADASHQQEVQAESNLLKNNNQISFTGQWSNESFLLDNRTHKGKVGYYHLGLFKPKGSFRYLLINLGWLKAPILRAEIPSPKLPTGWQTITLQHLPIINPIVWSTDHWPSPINKKWPKRIQSIDIERFQLATKYSIDPGYWQLIAGKGKLTELYKSSPYLNKHKHLGYAMQWLLIAIAALVVGIFSAIKIDETDNKDSI